MNKFYYENSYWALLCCFFVFYGAGCYAIGSMKLVLAGICFVIFGFSLKAIIYKYLSRNNGS